MIIELAKELLAGARLNRMPVGTASHLAQAVIDLQQRIDAQDTIITLQREIIARHDNAKRLIDIEQAMARHQAKRNP